MQIIFSLKQEKQEQVPCLLLLTGRRQLWCSKHAAAILLIFSNNFSSNFNLLLPLVISFSPFSFPLLFRWPRVSWCLCLQLSHSSALSITFTFSSLLFNSDPSSAFLPQNSTSSSSFKVFPHLFWAAHRASQTIPDKIRAWKLWPCLFSFVIKMRKCVWKLFYYYHLGFVYEMFCCLQRHVWGSNISWHLFATFKKQNMRRLDLWNEYVKEIFGPLRWGREKLTGMWRNTVCFTYHEYFLASSFWN